MKIVVTGGAGFIGSHITELLCELHNDVIVVDDLSFGYKKFVDKRATFIKGNIGNISLMKKVLSGADAVMHLAASSIISFSYPNPGEYFQNNLMNGLALLEAMKFAGVKKIIFSSTAAVYGMSEGNPIKENDRKDPSNAYGASKLSFEVALGAYYHAYGIESVTLRYFNAYGPRDEQQPATRAVPMWIKAILLNTPVAMYWNGKQTRDYIYVKDIAKAHVDVLELRGLHTYNIGSGTGVLMKDIASEIENIAGRKLQIIDGGERIGDPDRLLADISTIKNDVGWEPTVPLVTGIQMTFDYFKQNLT